MKVVCIDEYGSDYGFSRKLLTLGKIYEVVCPTGQTYSKATNLDIDMYDVIDDRGR